MKIKNFITLAILLVGISSHAQYTLVDDDVTIENGILTSFSNSIEKNIIIPEQLDNQTIISIGEGAFMYKDLTNVVIPNSVKSIGFWAFMYNELESVIIPNSVNYIGGGAFNNNKIISINGVESNGIIFGRNEDGSDDTSIIVSYGGISDEIDFIPNSVTTFADDSFQENGLTSVVIHDGVINIGRSAFYSNDLSYLTIPNSVTHINYSAFLGNKLSEVTIPSSVVFIGKGAFRFNNISSIKLPEAIKEGYLFENWNGNILANTEVSDLNIEYVANFVEDSSLSINNIYNQTSINIYPNPANEYFSISGAKIEKIEVINYLGKKVKIIESSDNITKVNLQDISNGVYFLNLFTETGTVIKRMIIE